MEGGGMNKYLFNLHDKWNDMVYKKKKKLS